MLDIAFSNNPLDRDDKARNRAGILAMDKPDDRFLLMLGDQILSDEIGRPVWLSPGDLDLPDGLTRVFLGFEDAVKGRYAIHLSHKHEAFEAVAAHIMALGKPRDARAIAMKLGAGAGDLGIVAQAKSLLDWHARHGFCANCGAPTDVVKGGYQRDCASCGARHFPRTDPVAIMLATHGDKVLVGRGPHLPPGFFSALAGFIEPGETIEEAVRRELFEEAGVRAGAVSYIASQPWPWPSSLMIGCTAEADSFDVKPDGVEIDDVRWLDKSQMREAMLGKNPEIAVPPPIAIAHQLIKNWLES